MSVREMSVKSGFTPSVGGKRVLHSFVSALIAGVVIGIFHILREQNQLWDNCSPEELDDRMNIMHIASCGFFVLSTGSSFLLYRTPSAPQDKRTKPIRRRRRKSSADFTAQVEAKKVTKQDVLNSLCLEGLKADEPLHAIYDRIMKSGISFDDKKFIFLDIHKITGSWDQLIAAAFHFSFMTINSTGQESEESNQILEYFVAKIENPIFNSSCIKSLISQDIRNIRDLKDQGVHIAQLKQLVQLIQPLYSNPVWQ